MTRLTSKCKSIPIQIRASFWFLICTVLQRSISIITTPIFTRLLTTEEYGQYSVFLSWMGILTCFVTMYIYSGIYPQAIVKFEEERSQYSSAMQGLTIALVTAWLCVYFILINFWNKLFTLNTPQMLAMFVIMWANAIFGFWSAEQRVEYRYRKLVIVTLIEAILQPVLCVVLILLSNNDKVTGLVWGIAIATFLSYVALLIRQLLKGKVFFSKKIWSYSLKLAIPLIPHYISTVLLNSSDRIMIQKLVGDGQAGIYNLAYTVSICGTLISQAMLQTLQPWIFQKIKADKYEEIKKVAYPALVVIAVVNLLVVLFTPELIRLFGPESYHDAIWVMPPIAMSVFFMFMYNLFSTFEFYYEKSSYVSAATVIGAALNIALNYVFIKQYGYYAAGYTTLFCYIVFAVAHYLFMRRICRKEINNTIVYDVKILILISVAFLLCGFALMVTYDYQLLRYGIVAAVIVAGFILRKKLVRVFKIFVGSRKASV
ncbi:MAG: oligosaccharide flippase family protein [Firmicutes bacterium]|nr:oligosaccharide flippase family protein [Bacillota bacterium]